MYILLYLYMHLLLLDILTMSTLGKFLCQHLHILYTVDCKNMYLMFYLGNILDNNGYIYCPLNILNINQFDKRCILQVIHRRNIPQDISLNTFIV